LIRIIVLTRMLFTFRMRKSTRLRQLRFSGATWQFSTGPVKVGTPPHLGRTRASRERLFQGYGVLALVKEQWRMNADNGIKGLLRCGKHLRKRTFDELTASDLR
jgi:hypothetical protein